MIYIYEGSINRSIVTIEALLHCWMNDTADKPFVTLLKDNRSIVTTEALLHCWMNDTTDKPFVTLLKDLKGDKHLKDFASITNS